MKIEIKIPSKKFYFHGAHGIQQLDMVDVLNIYWYGRIDSLINHSLDQFQSYSDAYNCADLFDFHCEKEQEEKFTLQYELACMAVIIHGGGDGCD